MRNKSWKNAYVSLLLVVGALLCSCGADNTAPTENDESPDGTPLATDSGTDTPATMNDNVGAPNAALWVATGPLATIDFGVELIDGAPVFAALKGTMPTWAEKDFAANSETQVWLLQKGEDLVEVLDSAGKKKLSIAGGPDDALGAQLKAMASDFPTTDMGNSACILTYIPSRHTPYSALRRVFFACAKAGIWRVRLLVSSGKGERAWLPINLPIDEGPCPARWEPAFETEYVVSLATDESGKENPVYLVQQKEIADPTGDRGGMRLRLARGSEHEADKRTVGYKGQEPAQALQSIKTLQEKTGSTKLLIAMDLKLPLTHIIEPIAQAAELSLILTFSRKLPADLE